MTDSQPIEWATEATCERLAAEARSWLGTPFRHRAAVKQAGVDCVMLMGEIFRGSGLVEEYAFPRYTLDYSKHQDRSLLREFLDAHPLFTLLWEGEKYANCPAVLRAGDVACFRVGKTEHHAGLMLDALHFVHAAQPAGVVLGRVDDSTFADRLTCVYRPLKTPRFTP